MKIGRIIGAAILGFFFLLFVGSDLVLFGVVPLNSVIVTILPAAGLVIGGVLGGFAGNRTKPRVDELQPPISGEPFAPPTPM
jgi:hypothetical protein